MILGKRGIDLLRQYEKSIGEEMKLVARLDKLLREGCKDLHLIVSVSQEAFAVHHRSVEIYFSLQKYRLHRNLGMEQDAD